MGRLKWIWLQAKGRLVFGRRVTVFGNFTVVNPKNIKIGSNCAINHDAFLLGRVGISIGDNVVLSARCMLLDAGLDSQASDGLRDHDHVASPIIIENGVWIGAGAIILPGVTIGPNSIVGAGSLVRKDVPPRTIVAGNPAKIIRPTGPDEEKLSTSA